MKKIFKRTLATILVVLMLLTSAPLQGFVELEWPEIDLSGVGDWFSSKVSASDVSGKCGDNVAYTYNSSTKEVVISGSGKMYDYGIYSSPFCGVRNEIKTVIIENGVTSIGKYLFYYCEKLENLTIPDSVIDIENYAFAFCFNLESVVIPDSVTKLWDYSFAFCDKLTNITLGKNVKFIRNSAFRGCNKLKTVELPDSLVSICEGAFAYCSNLTDIVIPVNVTDVEKGAFSNSNKLEKINFLNKSTRIGDDVKTIPENTVIYGYANSTAQHYAKKYNREFILLSEFVFSKETVEIDLGRPVEGAYQSLALELEYNPTNGDNSKFDISKLDFTASDKSMAEFVDKKKLTLGKEKTIISVKAKTKKVGETKVIAKYDGQEVAECKLIVKQPNELKFEIEEPNFKYYEIDGVFFDDSNYLSEDGISLAMKYSNDFIEGLDYLITDPELLKQLDYEKVKFIFEIEDGEGLSFENVDSVRKKEIEIKDFAFLEEDEDKLNIFCTDSDALGQFGGVNAKIKYSVQIFEKGEYVENASDYLEFEVQSYKKHYIEEHSTTMVDEDRFKKVMQSGFAKQMKGLEETKNFSVMQILNDSLIKNIFDAAGPLDENQAYHIAVANLISTLGNDIDGSVSESITKMTLDTSSQILEIFLEIAEKKFNPDMKDFLSQLSPDKIYDHIMGRIHIKELDGFTDMALEDTYYRSKLLKTMGGTEIVNKICKVGGIVLNTIKDIRNVILINSALDSIENILKEQADVINAILKKAISKGEYALASALVAYTTYESSKTDSLIKVCVDGIMMANVDSIVTVVSLIAGKTIKEAIAEKIKSTFAETVFSAGATVVGAVFLAYEYGRLVSDLFFNNSEYADASLMIVMSGHMSEIVSDVIYDYHALMLEETELDKAFGYAKSLDFALNMYKKLELIACDSTIKALKSRETSTAVRFFFKQTGKKYSDVISEVNVRKIKLASTYCHDICLANIYAKVDKMDENGDIYITNNDRYLTYKTLCVQCPVDVFVRDSKGQLVAAVENNIVTKEADGVGITVIEDEKFITLPSTDEYDVEILATDAGTMDYTVYEYGKESAGNIRSVSYESVPLTKNKEFTAKLDTEKFTDKNNYNLSTGSQTITATSDDYVPLTAISLSGDKNTALVGNEITLSVTTAPENASPEAYNWTSSDESIATVRDGVVKALKAGKATITCEVKNNSDIKASFAVTVNDCSHSFSEWETVEESSCNEYGYKKRSCSGCNAVETEMLTELKPHEAESTSYDLPASCTRNASTITLCKNCGEICNRVEKQGTAKGHNLGAVTVDKKATTENSGSQSQKCSTCGEKVNVTKIPRVITPSLAQTSFIFDAKAKTPKLTIKDIDGNILEKNVDYTLKTDSGRINPGTYKSVVTFIGRYEGTSTLKFTIAMQKPTVKATQTTSSIKLDWTAVTAATGYRVYYQTASGWKLLGTTTKLAASFKNLKAGAKYTFAVQPISKVNGEEIRATNFATINTAVKALTPSKISATQSTSSIKLSWSKVAGATGYRIYYKSGNTWKTTVSSTTATSYTFKNLKAGVKYTFAVKPYVKNGDTIVWSDYKSYTTATLPATVTAKASSSSSGKIALSWNQVSGSEGYRVYYKTGNGSFKLYRVVGASTKSMSFSNLKSGTKYTFAVRAGIKTSGGTIMGGYKTATVTVK